MHHGGRDCISSVYCLARVPHGTWHIEDLRNIMEGETEGRGESTQFCQTTKSVVFLSMHIVSGEYSRLINIDT